jgi:hypothetical protein
MFEDAKKRMGFKNEASYKAALKATYRQEAGAKAQITVQSISSVKELDTLMTKSSYETVIVNSHAYLNKRALIIGNEDLTPDDLERIVGAGKHAPKKFFFYGCNSAKTGFAGDVAARLPNSEVTGSSNEIRQTSKLEKNQLTIQEDRRFNQTFKKGGTVVDDARKVDLNSSSAISRDEFR